MKKIKILFINPVIRNEDSPRHIPYGMAQLAAIARDGKYNIQVFDANAWRPTDSQLRGVLTADRWDVIAIGGLVTTYAYIKKCIGYARKICPGALIIAGGGFLSAIPRDIMELLPEIDVGVIGEGVVTFPEILRSIAAGERDLSGIAGIIRRDEKGNIRLTGGRPLLEDVDSLPFPAYEMFPMKIYFKNSPLLMSEESMQAKRRIDVMASYGCPFRCKYCFHLGMSGEIKTDGADVSIDTSGRRKIRAHSPEYVVDLVKYARKKFGIDFVSFIDENFIFLDKFTRGRWIPRFSKLWRREGLVPDCIKKRSPHDPKVCKGIHWGTTAHAGLVNPKLLNDIRRIGCSYLDYGFESFDDGILRSIGKGATAKDNEQALVWTLKAGIRPVPNQIIGFPDESFASIKTSMAAWKRLGIRSYPFFATPYPGSEWYVHYRDRILDQYGGDLDAFLSDLGDATKVTAVISNRFNAVELLGIRELMASGNVKRIEEYEHIREKTI